MVLILDRIAIYTCFTKEYFQSTFSVTDK
ncbi:unnamed protein product [Callosobruchus maculatus]|uniref:Uncharacterized protein n=1 Tax=Callosobruchus maculatus TaxID=64391 RepID=A0A653CIH7_CALMS|nr:unnamed protein product [Callosobruchus maculatus]